MLRKSQKVYRAYANGHGMQHFTGSYKMFIQFCNVLNKGPFAPSEKQRLILKL